MSELDTPLPTLMPAKKPEHPITSRDEKLTKPVSQQRLASSRVARVRRLAERELKSSATGEELAFLYRPENLYLWYRALEMIKNDAQNHIMIRKSNLSEVPVTLEDGVTPNPEYLAKKRELEHGNGKRLFFISKVREKMIEVSTMIADQGMTRRDCTRFASALSDVKELIELNEIDEAVEDLARLIDQLALDIAKSVPVDLAGDTPEVSTVVLERDDA